MNTDGHIWVRIGGMVHRQVEEHGNETQGDTGGQIYVCLVTLVAGKFPDFDTWDQGDKETQKQSGFIGDGFGWRWECYGCMKNTRKCGGGSRMSN